MRDIDVTLSWGYNKALYLMADWCFLLKKELLYPYFLGGSCYRILFLVISDGFIAGKEVGREVILNTIF